MLRGRGYCFAFLGLLADVVYTWGEVARTEPFPRTLAPVLVVIMILRARKGHGIRILCDALTELM